MKIDLFTFVIYTVLMVLLIIPSYRLANLPSIQVRRDAYWKIGFALILFYSLVIGLRFEVGRDYEIYLRWFKILKATGNFPVKNSDYLYLSLNKLLVYANAHYAFLFIIIAFLQIYFLFKALEKTSFLLPWYFFFFFTTLFMFSSMNHMRQTISYFIFFYTITLFLEKKYWLVIILILIAAGLHKSVLLFVWVYPFLKIDWYRSRIIQFCLLLFSIVIADKLFELILSTFSSYVSILGYGYYVENVDLINERTLSFAEGSGLGKYLFFFIDGIIILFSPKLKQKFAKFNFLVFYNLYFTGVILENVVVSNYILSRSMDYFSNFRTLILSFLCYYLWKNKSINLQNRIFLAVITLTLLAYFYRGIAGSAAGCSPFQFVSE